jgi:hydroxypyruvate reductase
LSAAKLREHARQIFDAGVRAVNPKTAVHKFVVRDSDALIVSGHEYDLKNYARVMVVGAGKASAAMAAAVEEIVGDRISEGLVNVKYQHVEKLEKVRLNEAGHPLPDESGLAGARQMAEMLGRAGERDLVLCLISGGGSALLPLPADGISLSEKQEVTKKLLACGATINEMNAARKHLSKIKGGQLARLAHPATVIALILSDVVGDPLDVIASGPTAPDNSTFADVKNLFTKYELWKNLPKPIAARIEKGIAGEIAETPKADDAIFSKVQNVVIGSNILALRAAEDMAKSLGYHPLVLSSFVEGETRDVAQVHAAIAKEILVSGNPLSRPACVISGGETTVTLRGSGKGGRNQEFTLAAAIAIAGLQDTLIFSAGTDGTDGPTDAAGALCDGETVSRGAAAGLNANQHLEQNDAYPFFQTLGDLVITGPTNTNVMDLRLILVDGPARAS